MASTIQNQAERIINHHALLEIIEVAAENQGHTLDKSRNNRSRIARKRIILTDLMTTFLKLHL